MGNISPYFLVSHIQQTCTQANTQRDMSKLASHSFRMEHRLTTALCCNIQYTAYELLAMEHEHTRIQWQKSQHKLIRFNGTLSKVIKTNQLRPLHNSRTFEQRLYSYYRFFVPYCQLTSLLPHPSICFKYRIE